MATLTEITLQLIHKKLDEILVAIKDNVGSEHMEDVYKKGKKSITQEQFNSAMEEVMNLINKKNK